MIRTIFYYSFLLLIGFNALSGCVFHIVPAEDVKAEVNKHIAVGMTKEEAMQKLSRIDFTCSVREDAFLTSTQTHVPYILCTREEGFSNEVIMLSLSSDRTMITSISYPQIHGIGL